MPPVLADPVGDRAQRLWLQPAGPPLRLAALLDETGPLKHLEVLRDSGQAHVEGRSELCDRCFTEGLTLGPRRHPAALSKAEAMRAYAVWRADDEAGGVSRQRGPNSAAIEALRSADPVMARLIDRLDPIDLATWRARWSLDSFGSLTRSIVGQQIATRAATAIFRRLQALIGDRDPAVAIAAASDAELRAVGLSAAKAASLRDLAARILDGRLDLGGLGELTDDEAHAQLTAVRGIGPWTADMFLLGQLGRPDVLPAADLGIRRAVQAAYALGRMPSETEVRRLGEAWRPNRSLATAYLYSSLWSQRPPQG
jgi:DNA-3-methyladenine glycosylase II